MKEEGDFPSLHVCRVTDVKECANWHGIAPLTEVIAILVVTCVDCVCGGRGGELEGLYVLILATSYKPFSESLCVARIVRGVRTLTLTSHLPQRLHVSPLRGVSSRRRRVW